MYLSNLKIFNFKNCSSADLTFSEKINCFVGFNGAGKTNLLDAIYYLSFCKSYFNPSDTQNIRHGEDFFSVHGVYYRNGSPGEKVSVVQKRNQKKQFSLNEKVYDRLADHIGLFPLVMISPYDRDMINEGSETRRKYIDSVISQWDKTYLNHLLSYNKALFQRNRMLKDFAERGRFDPELLDAWNHQLTESGNYIHQARKEFLERFLPLFNDYYRQISGSQEEVSMLYESQLSEKPLNTLLAESIERDRAVRYTTCGIHKDDLVMLINGYPVKKFGSQGQQKSYVIAIRLAQFDLIRQIKGYNPLLLLDDIFDKLDERRVKYLIHLVGENNFGQVFITDTQHERINRLFEQVDISHKIYEVNNGVVSPVNG
ncbi:MAG: DNA replication and repair protein RecF [Bacteroidales bacterium]